MAPTCLSGYFPCFCNVIRLHHALVIFGELLQLRTFAALNRSTSYKTSPNTWTGVGKIEVSWNMTHHRLVTAWIRQSSITHETLTSSTFCSCGWHILVTCWFGGKTKSCERVKITLNLFCNIDVFIIDNHARQLSSMYWIICSCIWCVRNTLWSSVPLCLFDSVVWEVLLIFIKLHVVIRFYFEIYDT
jgi:hypothetical protein